MASYVYDKYEWPAFGRSTDSSAQQVPTDFYHRHGIDSYMKDLSAHSSKHDARLTLQNGYNEVVENNKAYYPSNFTIKFYNMALTKQYDKDGTCKFIKVNTVKDILPYLHKQSQTNAYLFKSLVLVRIKDYLKSSELFLFTKKKKAMMDLCADTTDEQGKIVPGKLFTINQVLPLHVCRKDNVQRDVIELAYEGRNYKFLVDELEFIYPSYEDLTKGYNAPKDRKVKKGKMIIVKNNKGTVLPHKYKTEVVNTLNVGYKKYVELIYNNKVQTISMKKVKVV